MSSLRLALKQSLENSILTNISSKSSKGKSLYQHPSATSSTFGLSDKELRRRQQLENKSDSDDDDSGDDDDDDSPLRGKRKKGKGKKKIRSNKGGGGGGERNLKKKDHRRRKENKGMRREELSRRIIADGGTEIRVGGGEGSGVGFKGSSKICTGADNDESMSSSSLSSSSSGSSTSSSSDSDSNSNTSSSSSSSDSSASTTDDDDNDDDDDVSSSDDGSINAAKNEGAGETKGWKGKARRDRGAAYSSGDADAAADDDDDGSLNSSSDSDDTIIVADRESKMLFDADLSSGGSDAENGYGGGGTGGRSADDERRRRRVEKKSKMLKRAVAVQRARKRKKDDAANTIQNQWKKKSKKRGGGDDGDGGDDDDGHASSPDVGVAAAAGPAPPRLSPSGGGSDETGGGAAGATVESPSPEVLSHIRSMPTKSQRRAVHPGLRVKVRFVKKARSPHGRTTRWYGGVVCGVSSGGRRIRVHYDDGTNEVADFPDKDIIIDDRDNGRHVYDGSPGGPGYVVGGGGRGGKGGGGGAAGSAFAPPPRRTSSTMEGGDASSDDEDEAIADPRPHLKQAESQEGDAIVDTHPRPKPAKSRAGGGAGAEDDEGGNAARSKSKKSHAREKKKKRRRERIADAKGGGGGGNGLPSLPENEIGVRHEEASPFDATEEGGMRGGDDMGNEDAFVIDLVTKKRKKATVELLSKVSVKDKHRDSLSDVSIGSVDGGSGERGEITEIRKLAKNETAPLRYDDLVHGKKSSVEEEEEKAKKMAESKSSPSRLESTDPGENEEEISNAQSNGYSPEIEEGELPEDGRLQSTEMREDGDRVNKPVCPPPADAATAQSKYHTNKPQDEGLLDEGCTKADQGAVADTAHPPYAANRPNTARSSSSSSGSNCLKSSVVDSSATAVVDLSPTAEIEKTVSTAAALVSVKLPSHIDVEEFSSKYRITSQQPQQLTAMQEEQDETLSSMDKEESKKEHIAGEESKTKGIAADSSPPPPPPAAAGMTVYAEDQAQHHQQPVLTTQPPELKKKRGPLSIRIGLPGAKRKKQMEEEMKLKQQVLSGADDTSPETPSSSFIEPSKKKQKISTHIIVDNGRIGDDSINDKVMKVSDPSLAAPARLEMQPIVTQEKPTSLDITSSKEKEGDDDSLSDGEIQEDGEVHEDDTHPMTVDTNTKKVRSFISRCVLLKWYPLVSHTFFPLPLLSNNITRLRT